MHLDRALFGLLLALCALPWAAWLAWRNRGAGAERMIDGAMHGLGYGIALAAATLVVARLLG